MLTRINKHRDEAGFTLIELLVVVIIIGILAAIAIPVFLNQRASAQNASVQSDLRNAAIEVETYYTQNQAYPTEDVSGAAALASGVVLSTSNIVTYEYVDATSFKLHGCNTNAQEKFVYDSSTGGLVQGSTDDGTCATTTAAGQALS
jgi:type IV pilus assembly protein PilA